MKEKLSQPQRLLTAFLYVITIIALYTILSGNIMDIFSQSTESTLWFFSGILLIIMGSYVTEPYFSSPTDTFANSISLILVLSASDHSSLIGYKPLLIFSYFLFLLSLLHIIFKNTNKKFKNLSYWIMKNVGSSTVLYSFVYLLSAYSFFALANCPMFTAAIAVWICIVFFDVYGKIIRKISSLICILKSKSQSPIIGYAIRSYNANSFTISIPKSEDNVHHFSTLSQKVFIVKSDSNTYTLALAAKKDYTIDSILLTLLTLTENGHPVEIKRPNLQGQGINIHYNESIGAAHEIDLSVIASDLLEKINKSPEYLKQESLLGFVLPDSDISVIRFSLNRDNSKQIKEGNIVSVNIFGEDVLYQITNGITKTDTYNYESASGYICCTAHKLGIYNFSKNLLNSAKWVPSTNECVYLYSVNTNVDYQEIAKSSIGVLPESDMKIPIQDINALVTHNTAILGILGIGKSCLTFELIKKIVMENIKVICIDITNQYAGNEGLSKYVTSSIIRNDCSQSVLEELATTASTVGSESTPQAWENVNLYSDKMFEKIHNFLSQTTEKILIINPDIYRVKKTASASKIATSIDVSLVEKTRIISEQLLKVCMDMGQTASARCCLVFEEAHSLVPEWNSSVAPGDDRDSNGTARVILQGRKYGLGCILITQRTANVTKSILNQCNTIFALRVFDDTGKTFLENYIGKEYSDSLPALADRHAIAIGKGIGLKQPVIIQLNNRDYLMNQ